MAIGALFECQRLGINVPQQIKIAGFHGHDVGQSLTPQLASVMTPRLEMGRVAAQELLDRIHGVPQQSPIINLGYHIHLGKVCRKGKRLNLQKNLQNQQLVIKSTAQQPLCNALQPHQNCRQYQ